MSASTRQRRSSPPHKFDLALLAFWEPASRLLPILREGLARDPRGRGLDRRALPARGPAPPARVRAELDERFGAGVASELSAYREADAVLTVSSTRPSSWATSSAPSGSTRYPWSTRGAVADPLRVAGGDPVRRQLPPHAERRGGPSTCATTSCRGSRRSSSPSIPCTWWATVSTRSVAAQGRGLQMVKMVGWVPSVAPYLERARVCVVPLLHGAGVKGKVVESLMAGTPVVTTTFGAEGLELRHGEHVLIADTPEELADGLAHLLTDRERWEHLVDAGYEHVAATHAPEQVAERFDEVLDKVLAAPTRAVAADGARCWQERARASYRDMTGCDRARRCTRSRRWARACVVVSRGDDSLLACEDVGWGTFRRSPDGQWAGHPKDERRGDRAPREPARAAGRATSWCRAPSSGGSTTTASWLHTWSPPTGGSTSTTI